MKRNTFIKRIGLLGGAMLLPLATGSCDVTPIDPRLAVPHSLLPVCSPATMVDIGSRYRKMTPSENDAALLIRLLRDSLDGGEASLDRQILNRITRDYREGKLVEINGWMLALTETRQCALYSLFYS